MNRSQVKAILALVLSIWAAGIDVVVGLWPVTDIPVTLLSIAAGAMQWATVRIMWNLWTTS